MSNESTGCSSSQVMEDTMCFAAKVSNLHFFRRNGASAGSDASSKGTTLAPFLRNMVCSETSTHTTLPTKPRNSTASDNSISNDTQGSPRSVKNFDHTAPVRPNFKHSSKVTPLPSLQGNLMTCHQREEPTEYYQILDVLGEGSMGNVCRVKKRVEAIGGSARTSVMQSKEAKPWKFLQSCFSFCPFATTNSGSRSQDLLHVISNDEEDSSSQTQDSSLVANKSKSNNHSKLISHGHKDLVFALKSIKLDPDSSSDFMKELKNEVEILKNLDHPNIVRPIETFFDSNNRLCIVEELCDGGDLYSRDPYTEQDAAKITTSVFGAIAYMHSKNIIHRDIKYENIMFTSKSKNAEVKLIDFGLSKKYVSGIYLHDTVGTVYTMAPELLQGDYTSSVDIWSMGVVSYMLLSSSMPFFGMDRNLIIQQIMRAKYSFSGHRWKFVSPNARKFISLLLRRNPNKRPTAEKALKNPWLTRNLDQQKKSIAIVMDNVQASIQTFADYTKFKKLALMIVAYKSTSQEIGFLRQIFDNFDRVKDGVITLPIFKSTLKDYLYSDEELERMFIGMDIDGSGTVHYSEFLAATIVAHGSIDEERLAEAFDRLDFDNSGYITVGDLRKILGEDVPTLFLEEILDAVDMNHDHKVSYDEFLAMWDHTVDEIRMANQLKVKQRKIRYVDSEQTNIISTIPHCGISEFAQQKEMADMVSSFRTKPNVCPTPSLLPEKIRYSTRPSLE